MNDKRLKSYLQGRLGNYRYPVVDDTLWSSVSQSLPPGNRKRWLPFVAAAAGVAVLVGVFVLYTLSGGEKAGDTPVAETSGLVHTGPSVSVDELIRSGMRTEKTPDRPIPAAPLSQTIARDTERSRQEALETVQDMTEIREDTTGQQRQTPHGDNEPAHTVPERGPYTPWYPSLSAGQRRQRDKKLSVLLAVHGSGSSEERLYRENIESTFPSLASSVTPETDIYHPVYDFPLTFSLTVRKELSGLFAIESGLSYTYLHTSESNSETDIKLHYLGIPVKGICTFYDSSRLSLYTGVGGAVEKQIAGRLKNPDGDRSLVYSGLQWSVGASVGLQLRLSKHIGLFAEPGVRYFFDDGSNIPTLRKDKPFQFNFQVGLRFNTK